MQLLMRLVAAATLATFQALLSQTSSSGLATVARAEETAVA
jgi:hypothetical protein